MSSFDKLNLAGIKKIHFIGIKGVAMSGLAVICKQLGFQVAGSDVPEVFITDKILKKNKIKVFSDFGVKNLAWQPDLLVCGASWSENHPEILEAKNQGIKIIFDSDLRGWLSRQKKTVAVCGVHGKTTTTALLAYIFEIAGLKPSYLIGTGLVPDLGGNAAWQTGRQFIVEGDEYARNLKDKTPKFLDLSPQISIITSLEWEHVDIYKNVRQMEKVFSRLIKKTSNLVVACSDWLSIRKVIRNEKKVITYGFNKDADWRIINFKQLPDKTLFAVKNLNGKIIKQEMKLLGRHNALNALACLIIALNYKIPLLKFETALKKFRGAERRANISKFKGIIFIDDYGHHPSEIKATLLAIREKYPYQKIWCVFQPHTASRTRALLTDFAKSFLAVDQVVLTDIFASAREKAIGINSADLARAIKKYQKNVYYSGGLKEAAKYLKSKIKKGEVVVIMGAGDVYKIRKEIVD